MSAGLFVAVAALVAATPPLVTEADFLAPIDPAHPALAAGAEVVARAEAQRRRAGALPNPRVEYGREDPDPSARQMTVVVAWAPPLDGRRGLAVKAAEAGMGAARQRFSAEALRVRAELRAAFAEWAGARQRSLVLSEHAALLARQAQGARERAEAGEESGLARRRLELAAAEARAAASLAEGEAARAEAQARAWRPDLPPDATPVPPTLPDPPRIDASSSPELEALRLEAEQAQLEERLAGRFWTFPELQGGWQKVGLGTSEMTGPILGLSWSVPVFDRNQAARQEARARRELATARLALAERRRTAAVAGAQAAYAALRPAVEATLRAAQETPRMLESALAAFRAGEATVTDLLEVARAAQAARVQEIEVRAAALAAQRELELAVGRPLDTAGVR